MDKGLTRRALSLSALTLLLAAGSVFATDQSKLAVGANFESAHARSTGAGVNIGIIEGGPRMGSNNVGARLLGQWGFAGTMPSAQAPVNNSAAATDLHITLVADIAAGSATNAGGGVTYLGVAPGASVFTGAIAGFPAPANVAQRDGDNAIYNPGFNSFRAAVNWMYTPLAAQPQAFLNHPKIALFNNSSGAGQEQDDNGDNRFARFVDYFARTRDALFVGAAGNEAQGGGNPNDLTRREINWPWDAYNCITVGATDAAFTARAPFSQYWLTQDRINNGGGGIPAPDIRGKPDIVAPGTNIGDGRVSFQAGTISSPPAVVDETQNNGTSFATPHVTGAAALIAAGTPTRPAGLPLGTVSSGGSHNHLAIKAILLNSARKRFIGGTNYNNATARDEATTGNQASDGNYLTVGGQLVANSTAAAQVTAGNTTRDWNPSEWSTTGGFLRVTKPLDDEQGTGLLDVRRALDQYDGGEQSHSGPNPGGVGMIGWNRSELAGNTAPHQYPLNFSVSAGEFLTATLCWDRVLVDSNTNDVVEDGDTYNDDALGMGALPNFTLTVFNGNNTVATSESLTDNLQHLHFPLPLDGSPLDYRIQVDLLLSGTRFYPYALAWQVPEPSTILALSAFALTLTRRRGRKGWN